MFNLADAVEKLSKLNPNSVANNNHESYDSGKILDWLLEFFL